MEFEEDDWFFLERIVEGRQISEKNGGKLSCVLATRCTPAQCLLSTWAPRIVQSGGLVIQIAKCLLAHYLELKEQKTHEKYKKFCLCKDLKIWQLWTWVQLPAYIPFCCSRVSCGMLQPPCSSPPPCKPGSKIDALTLSCPVPCWAINSPHKWCGA